jgi:hypothetical protein
MTKYQLEAAGFRPLFLLNGRWPIAPANAIDCRSMSRSFPDGRWIDARFDLQCLEAFVLIDRAGCKMASAIVP